MFAGVTIMLSITIYATIVGDTLPVSDATPLIGQRKKKQPNMHINQDSEMHNKIKYIKENWHEISFRVLA